VRVLLQVFWKFSIVLQDGSCVADDIWIIAHKFYALLWAVRGRQLGDKSFAIELPISVASLVDIVSNFHGVCSGYPECALLVEAIPVQFDTGSLCRVSSHADATTVIEDCLLACGCHRRHGGS
jgi:hypothetical protein